MAAVRADPFSVIATSAWVRRRNPVQPGFTSLKST